ncbi:MAG: biotin--[acetyl-CoA-carboxylase] ligase [Candidatus Neomarinimicrobiota bacterium]|nr:biotin--[acetyl-CoA-carboxylase] ligase [Candidatus Neomarinimicrobiota bacterium]MDD3967042.1 biotin--[acetyl-CoA-carboxylase] ligase [Candidatus Neomarinimicrobiota bacterium]MDX9779924.1 biotin--[acetyl-CoA-carboxylase] ligase [bacterium]
MSYRIGTRIFRVDSIPSSNTELLQNAERYAQGDVLIARQQTGGRGRYGREWVSDEGGLYMSFLLKTIRDPREVLPLSLLSALAVLQALKRCRDGDYAIKWPNDIYVSERKICGILPETRIMGSETHAVIGIGVNVNNELPGEESLRNPAISLRELRGENTDIHIFAVDMITQINDVFRKFSEKGFRSYLPALNALLYRRGHKMELHIPGGGKEVIIPLAFCEDAALRCIRRGKEEKLFLGEL